MSQISLSAAILVVSTTASQEPSTDASSAILRNVFAVEGGGQWRVVDSKIAPDSVVAIQRAVTQWTDCENPVNLVVTTGGTGFAVSDTTPEAINPLLHKNAPGLVHGMLAVSLIVTPFAMMSRPVAGVRNQTIIITLPGSPKGAKENLQSVLKLLPHACLQAAGANSRKLHAGGVKKLEADAGISPSSLISPRNAHSSSLPSAHDHAHGHGHALPIRHAKPTDRPQSNDPSLGPTKRHRSSPYPMISVEEALALIEEHTPAPSITDAKVDGGLVGAVLAQDVQALEAVPPFRASIVDGYAVTVLESNTSIRGTFPVASISHAAPGRAPPLKPGQLARITTGAPLPPGATSVIMVEDTVLKSMTDDGKEEKEVELLADNVSPGENVREVGSDVQEGSIILRKGEEISAIGGELGLLASVGVQKVSIYRRPIVGILSTGDEIVPHDQPGSLRHGQVRDTNRPTIISAVRNAGYEAVDLGIAEDLPEKLEEKLRAELQHVDVIITTGGVSMGELDLLKPTIERSLGGTIHFGRITMKPGKPTTFATVSVKNHTGERVSKTIFSLPGNPASAIVTFNLFVLPSLHYASGVTPGGLPQVWVTLTHDIKGDTKRKEYHRAVVTAGKDGLLYATSTGGQRSSRIGSLKSANALLSLPMQDESLQKGDRVSALLMGHVRSNSLSG